MSARSRRRIIGAAVITAALMLALVGRTYDLSILRGDALRAVAESNSTRLAPTIASRGLIVDRTGRPLAGNQGALSLQIDRDALPQDRNERDELLHRVAADVGITKKRIEKALIACGTEGAPRPPKCNQGDAAFPVIALVGVKRNQVQTILELPQQYPGVTVVEHGQRSYPKTKLKLGHLLGYVGRINREELAKNPSLSPTTLVGRSGLEQFYNDELAGVAGIGRSKVDALGRVQNRDKVSESEVGATLVTSIDAKLQLAVERNLDENLGGTGRKGGAVVLDIKTGRVLAMGSYPTYHPKIWANGISNQDFRALSKSEALLNQPLQGMYAPGSTFKPIAALAMARSGENLHGTYSCPSAINVGGHSFGNYGGSSHGSITLATALQVSCNTVFYGAAMKYWHKDGGLRKSKTELGAIAKAAKDVGLGQTTGIDLPGESAGRMASPRSKHAIWSDLHETWCARAKDGHAKLAKRNPARAQAFTAMDRENCKSGNQWRLGDAINAGVGQGLTVTTPLQMAAAYATLLGDGKFRAPTVGRAIVDADGQVNKIKPRASKTRVGKKVRKFLRSALARVPAAGTASGVFADFPLDKYEVMGKTGTAQVEGKKDTSWFVSAAPAKSPQYAIAVAVPEGGTGGETAAPIAKAIWESIYGVKQPAVLPKSGPSYEIPKVKALQRSVAQVQARRLARIQARKAKAAYFADLKEQAADLKRQERKAKARAASQRKAAQREAKQLKAAKLKAKKQAAAKLKKWQHKAAARAEKQQKAAKLKAKQRKAARAKAAKERAAKLKAVNRKILKFKRKEQQKTKAKAKAKAKAESKTGGRR